MPDTLDLTAIQSNTGNYISEISELIGQEGGSETYQNFLSSLYAIRAMTDYFYTPDAAGNFSDSGRGSEGARPDGTVDFGRRRARRRGAGRRDDLTEIKRSPG